MTRPGESRTRRGREQEKARERKRKRDMSRRNGGGFSSDEDVVVTRVRLGSRARHMHVAEAGDVAAADGSGDVRHATSYRPVGAEKGRRGPGSASAGIGGRASLPLERERGQDTRGDAAMSDIQDDRRDVHNVGAPRDYAVRAGPGSVPGDEAHRSAVAREGGESREQRTSHGAAERARNEDRLARDRHVHDAAALSVRDHERGQSVTGDWDTAGMARMTGDSDGVNHQSPIDAGHLSVVGEERSSDVMEAGDGHVRAEDTGGGML